ncbi:uncharacterized protein ACBT44_017085 isoform 1-T1 [Syngnathus typhle]
MDTRVRRSEDEPVSLTWESRCEQALVGVDMEKHFGSQDKRLAWADSALVRNVNFELWEHWRNPSRRPQLWQSLLSGPPGRRNQATSESSAEPRLASSSVLPPSFPIP